MKIVNNSTTTMNPKKVNGKSHPVPHNSAVKPLVIADLQFLFRLFRQFPDPFPEESCPALQLPDVLAHALSPEKQAKLQVWQQSGAISICPTNDALFEEAARNCSQPGMQTTDYVALLTARRHKQIIITSTKIITGEASRLKVQTTDGNLLLQAIGNGTVMEVMRQHRVRKNKINLTEAPALIAGNNLKV